MTDKIKNMPEIKSVFNSELYKIEEDNTTWHITTTVVINTMNNNLKYMSEVVKNFHRPEKRETIVFNSTYAQCYNYLKEKFYEKDKK